ncbi:MAG: aa3-type cytochrome c oxidase subunit IV [Alphaproteobacteria bacterium]
MEPEMQFLRAPKEHLETWHGVGRFVLYGSIGVAVLLLLMAATLV